MLLGMNKTPKGYDSIVCLVLMMLMAAVFKLSDPRPFSDFRSDIQWPITCLLMAMGILSAQLHMLLRRANALRASQDKD